MRFLSSQTIVAASLIFGSTALAAQDTTSKPTSIVPLERTALEVDTVDRIVAVVGKAVITWSDVVSAVNRERAQGLKIPDDVEGQIAVAHRALEALVDSEILIQKAAILNIEVTDQEVNRAVDEHVGRIRAKFKDEIEYRAELKDAGFGTPEEFRRSTAEEIRRVMLQQKVYQELQKTAKPAGVTDKEVDEAFQRARPQLQQRPATLAFRQIIMAPKPSRVNDSIARAKAESILAELKAGANFEALAKRESADPGSKEMGGDLGWNRRGRFVQEFEAAMFSLRPGQLSPVVKTQFGYHIIRVDRVQPAEVKVSHILIAPEIDSIDIARTKIFADSVANLWKGGMSYDSLVAKFHDRDEGKGMLEPYPVDSLPDSYLTAVKDLEAGQISNAFELRGETGSIKFAVVQVVSRTGPGEYSLPEVRQNIRYQLSLEKQSRAILDELRHRTYVSLRL